MCVLIKMNIYFTPELMRYRTKNDERMEKIEEYKNELVYEIQGK